MQLVVYLRCSCYKKKADITKWEVYELWSAVKHGTDERVVHCLCQRGCTLSVPKGLYIVCARGVVNCLCQRGCTLSVPEGLYIVCAREVVHCLCQRGCTLSVPPPCLFQFTFDCMIAHHQVRASSDKLTVVSKPANRLAQSDLRLCVEPYTLIGFLILTRLNF